MYPIARLMDEHRRIEQVLDALEGFVNVLESGQDTNHRDLQLFGEFFKNYADKLHHMKEEDGLFTSMEEAGFSKSQGPISVMLADHDTGRQFVNELEKAGQLDELDERVKSAVSKNARGFSYLLRAHIHKEDQILYPMAVNRVSPQEFQELETSFEEIQEGFQNSGELSQLEKIADDLIAKYC
ncbi:hemerythrin domain-containing protein [bacterium]|nr:hemerythrin domain-containing protein [bacterium]